VKLLNHKSKQAGVKAFRRRFNNSLADKDIQDLLQLSETIREREYNWENQIDEESLICKYIGATTWESFTRFGDRKRASDSLILHWIRKDGEPLDVQAMWLSNDIGKEITPSQFAEFMTDHDGGCAFYPYHAETRELKNIFKEITGFNWTYKIHNYLETFHLSSFITEPANEAENPF
jgi:hypothetical protein